MAKRKAYIQLRQGWFRQIGLAPKKGSSEKKLELPCGDCLEFFVRNSLGYGGVNLLIRCAHRVRRRYGELSVSNTCADGERSKTISVGKSPTGYVKVWYIRRHQTASTEDNCEKFFHTTQQNNWEETLTFTVNTDVGCSNEEGGTFNYTISPPEIPRPSDPPICNDSPFYSDGVHVNSHSIYDDFLGYSYFADGHWTDRGYPTPP